MDQSGQACTAGYVCYARYEEPCRDDWEFLSKYHNSEIKPIISKIKMFTSQCVSLEAPKQKMWTQRRDLNGMCGTSAWVIEVAPDPTSPYKWKSQAVDAREDSAVVCNALLREKETACDVLDKRTDVGGWNMYGACVQRVADKSPFADSHAAERQKTFDSFASGKDLPDETGAPCGAEERCYVKYSETSPCENDWQLRNKHAISGSTPPIISYVKKYETKCLKKLSQINAVGRGMRSVEGWEKRPDLADNCGQSGLIVQAAKNPEGPMEVFAWAWKTEEASAEVCAELMKKKDEFCYLLPRETDLMGWNMFKKCITKSND